MKVTVITPTIGSAFLGECIASVRNQTYKNIEHIVVVDGKSRWENADEILKIVEFPNGVNEHICVLPYPTGTNRYNGHRVYGAATYFADGDYQLLTRIVMFFVWTIVRVLESGRVFCTLKTFSWM